MPGIVGLITTKSREQATAELLRMVEAIRHESFYQTGIWVDESLGVYVGWAGRANSLSEGMPLRNERGDVVLAFSGEEFPAPQTAHQLKERGHELKTEGPSYLVHLYEEDPTFPANLNGIFHGLLGDLRNGTATLFNDRYGMHRIYYHESKDGLYFSAEVKAILEVRPELRRADPQGVGEFIACGCVLENRTLFKDIHLLPPAAAWVFRHGSVARKGKYFEPREWEDQDPLEPESYYQALREVFSENLSRYCNGDERIGISLTGGLDTRAIMAWWKAPSGSVPCYTFGGMYRDCRDVHVARQVAAACGQAHQVISVGKDFLSQFSHYAERTVYLTDGCANVSRSPDLYANERARQIAPVRMTGLYGDEVLRHNRTFKVVQPASAVYREDLLSWVRQAQATYNEALKVHPLSFSVYRQAPWSQNGSLILERTQVAIRTPFLDNDLVRTVFRAPRSSLANNGDRLRLIQDGNPALRRIRTDLGFGDSSLPGKALQLFQNFLFRAEYAYDHGMPQWVAQTDHAFSSLHLERLFLGRHKFYHFRTWYRGPLAEYVRQMLLDSRTLSRPYIDRSILEPMVQAHTKGVRNYTTEIHQLLTLELLHRLFLDPK